MRKMCCNMCSESSTGSWAELQLPYCPSKQRGTFRKHVRKPFTQPAAPDCIALTEILAALLLLNVSRIFPISTNRSCTPAPRRGGSATTRARPRRPTGGGAGSCDGGSRGTRRPRPGMNCIKIGLPGKLILSKRKGLWESPILLKIVSENRFSGRTYFIQLVPGRGRRGRRGRTGSGWTGRASCDLSIEI